MEERATSETNSGDEVFTEGWRKDIFKELEEQDVKAVESIGILTDGDIRSALRAINECEAKRDETEEQIRIKELQRQRADRLYGV